MQLNSDLRIHGEISVPTRRHIVSAEGGDDVELPVLFDVEQRYGQVSPTERKRNV
jgi:hypothetical protein